MISGLGNDTFNVSGDVTADIISQDLNGRSAIINHGATSADADYNNVVIDGVGVAIADENLGKVIITEEAGFSEVVEDEENSEDTYTVKLVLPSGGVNGNAVAYVTVSATQSSTQDGCIVPGPHGDPAESVEISIDGGITWLAAAVLTFTASDWIDEQTVKVRAKHDDAAEGERKVMVSHSLLIFSPDQSDVDKFARVAIPNVEVRVLDDDLGALLIRESENKTLVLEGSDVPDGSGGFLDEIVDTYTARLSVAPTADVTVDLIHSADVVVLDETGTAITQLVYTAANWDIDRNLSVRAFDDAIRENTERHTIEHVLSSVDPVYVSSPVAEVDVTVVDNEAPRALVTQSDGATRLITGQSGDDYSIRLTSAPTDTVTVSLFGDGQTVLSSLAAGRPIIETTVGGAIAVNGVDFANNATDLDTMRRTDGGSWLDDGFRNGTLFRVTGGGANDGTVFNG